MMTLDGYVAGPNQTVANSLGEGGACIHDWAHRPRTIREAHGGGGDAFTARQTLAAGPVNEKGGQLVPLLLGGGARLFDDPGGAGVALELIRTIATPKSTYLKYRVTKGERS